MAFVVAKVSFLSTRPGSLAFPKVGLLYPAPRSLRPLTQGRCTPCQPRGTDTALQHTYLLQIGCAGISHAAEPQAEACLAVCPRGLPVIGAECRGGFMDTATLCLWPWC